MSEPLLSVDGLVAGYGAVRILRRLEIAAGPNQVTVVLGANGAGKTTLFRTLAGLLPVEAGEIRLAGERIDHLESDERVARGLVLVPEGRLIFAEMTIEENLRVGAFTAHARGKTRAGLESVYDLFPRLLERRRQRAGTLSGGEQQMLAIGRGLMARPQLLLLDEPTLGLAPKLAKQIFHAVRALVGRGITVLLAEQDVRRSLQLAARAYVLENGAVALSGTGDELLQRTEIRQAYLGL